MRRPCVDSLSRACVLALLAACVLGLLAACADDGDGGGGEYVPSYLTDLVEISTDAEGVLSVVRLDDGARYDVSAQQRVADVPDTTFRCRATYTLDGECLTLHGVAAVFSAKPVPADSFTVVVEGEPRHGSEYLPRDPVKVVSMWRSGGYVNMHLGVMTTRQGLHRYAFCEEEEGRYSLVHLRPVGDEESFTEHVYLSMPIPEAVGGLTFSVQTYEGTYTRTL